MRFVAILVASFLLFGCANVGELWDDWFGTSARRERPAPLPEFVSLARLTVVARASVGAAGLGMFQPAQWEGAVFAAGADGKLARFEAELAREAWRIDTGKRLSAGVGVGPELVVVATAKGEVLAFGHDGRPRWQAQVASEVLATPVVARDSVYVRTIDGRVYALDARDGKRRWVYQRQTPTLTVRSAAGLLLHQDMLFAGFGGGKLVALDAEKGLPRWEASVALPRGASELERIADVTSTPVGDGQRVCASAFQGRVACFETASGNPLWARDMSSFSGIALDGRALYVPGVRGTLHAFDKNTGASIWKQDRLAYRQLSAPLVLRGFVAVGDLEGQVHLLSREDGRFAARAATDGSPIRVAPQATSRGLLVQTVKGGVFILALD